MREGDNPNAVDPADVSFYNLLRLVKLLDSYDPDWGRNGIRWGTGNATQGHGGRITDRLRECIFYSAYKSILPIPLTEGQVKILIREL